MSKIAQIIEFNGRKYWYQHSKRNILTYSGDTGTIDNTNYYECMLIVQYTPETDEYYVLHMIYPYVKKSWRDDEGDEMVMRHANLEGVQRLAKKIE